MRFALLLAACAALLLASCEENDATDFSRAIEGAWDLIGYSDHGVSADAEGTAFFAGDGTFSIHGTITFPSEPTDTLDVAGTYTAYDVSVTLTTEDGVGTWLTAYSGNQVVLRLIGTVPQTSMTLRRPT